MFGIKSRQIKYPILKTEMIPFSGGLNEKVSSLEMKGGELIQCKNYWITEGSTGGYISVLGYERYSGKTKPSSIVASEIDHAARDTARADVGEVPGQGALRGSFIYKGEVYAIRDKVGGATAGLYKESGDGWTEISTATNPLSPGGRVVSVVHNFLGTTNEVVIWADGVNKGRMYNGTTVTVINNTGMGADDKPVHIAVHRDRLFLSYATGSLQYSNVGNPNDFTTGAGEIGVGFEITGLFGYIQDNLLIFGRKDIRVLEGQTPSNWILTSFSRVTGAIPYTVCQIFDTVIFASDSGVQTLQASQNYGNFESASLSEKIKRTYLKYKGNITCATVARKYNQYRLFFDNGVGLVITFFEKQVKGMAKIQYTDPVKTVCEGLDSLKNPIIFFSSNGGYLYQADIGTSFDGNIIETRASLSYYPYKYPRNLKRFYKVTLEVSSTDDITLNILPTFDYALTGVGKADSEDVLISGFGSIWGEDKWGTMKWSGSDVTNRVSFDLSGIATNMSVSMKTSSAYKRQHTLQNMITDYAIIGRQM